MRSDSYVAKFSITEYHYTSTILRRGLQSAILPKMATFCQMSGAAENQEVRWQIFIYCLSVYPEVTILCGP